MQSIVMRPKRFFHHNALFWLAILCMLFSLAMVPVRAAVAASASGPAVSSEHDPLVDAAFDHFYNLDYDRSIQEFERVLESATGRSLRGKSLADHDSDARALSHGRNEQRRIRQR